MIIFITILAYIISIVLLFRLLDCSIEDAIREWTFSIPLIIFAPFLLIFFWAINFINSLDDDLLD